MYGIRRPRGPHIGPPLLSPIEGIRDAMCLPPRHRDLLRCETTLAYPLFEYLIVFQLPRTVERDHDVQFQVLSVVSVWGSSKRLLHVDVPTVEVTARPRPKDPHGVTFTWPLQHQRAVSLPRPLIAPRVAAVGSRPVTWWEPKLCSFGDVGREQTGFVAYDDDRNLKPTTTVVQHFTTDEDLPSLPARVAPSAYMQGLSNTMLFSTGAALPR
jgi:hypothetical protein